MKHNRYVIMGLVSGMVAVLALAGCDRAERSSAAAAQHPRIVDDGGASLSRPAKASLTSPTPLYQGEPLWAENRHGSAEDNAAYQFRTRGKDLGAKSLDEFLTKVHAFFRHPPKGSEQVVRASNGDRLVYDRRANLFGVARKDGAPRVLMHPATGEAYWREQKARAGLGTRGSAINSGGGAMSE